MDKNSEIQFAIESFEIVGFSEQKPTSQVRKDRITFQIQHMFTTEVEQKLFKVGFRIQVFDGKLKKTELSSIETITSFSLKCEEPDFMNKIPEHLVVTFLSIAYSTTRGALMAKAVGSISGDVPMPLINPTQIVKNSVQREVV
jgi:hypothetical protein